jgi:hypothetical protein
MARKVSDVHGEYCASGERLASAIPTIGEPVKNDLFAYCSIRGLATCGIGLNAKVSLTIAMMRSLAIEAESRPVPRRYMRSGNVPKIAPTSNGLGSR